MSVRLVQARRTHTPSRRARSDASPARAASAVGCRYVDDRSPGMRRVRRGRGFRYLAPNGKPIADPTTLERIRRLAIPPAWTSVWICQKPNGHIQATGRDARGRKQYRYHERFRALREETKFDRMLEFAQYLPKIRATVDRDLGRTLLDRDKVLATVVRLLEISLIRIGNEEYARANGSFGLTTMRARHVDVHGSTIRFRFRGKSGKHHEVAVHDRRLAKIVQRCHDLPGQELFQYLDQNGELKAVDASDVNRYLGRITAGAFTAKDFRTWAGTVLMARVLRASGIARSRTASRKHIVAAAKEVAAQLGNTPSVCRRCYVHPAIFAAYVDGELRPMRAREGVRGAALSLDERAVVALLRARARELEVSAHAA